MYLDSAYIAKYYLPEPDAERVRKVISQADTLISSAISLAEIACVLHRQMREGYMKRRDVQKVADAFLEHVDSGLWTLIPVTDTLLRQAAIFVGMAPDKTFLRAGDAIHLTTAKHVGETEIWASDRHLLAAAPFFNLIGRSA
jgi:predicted nucleic acid-binding protein